MLILAGSSLGGLPCPHSDRFRLWPYSLDVIKRRGERIAVEGIDTTAECGLVYQGKNVIPTIKLTFKTPDKDIVTVEMSAYEASKLVDAVIVSLKTALPKIPRRR